MGLAQKHVSVTPRDFEKVLILIVGPCGFLEVEREKGGGGGNDLWSLPLTTRRNTTSCFEGVNGTCDGGTRVAKALHPTRSPARIACIYMLSRRHGVWLGASRQVAKPPRLLWLGPGLGRGKDAGPCSPVAGGNGIV